MQVERVSQTRITAAKTLPDLFQGVRDFLSEGHRRLVSISPHCLRRNEYALSFSFKSGEGLFESETLRTPLDFAGKMFKRGVERIVIRSGVLDADLSALVRVLENDFARESLREFSRPQIVINFIKFVPTPAVAPEARPSALLPSAAPAPKSSPLPSAATVSPASLTETQAAVAEASQKTRTIPRPSEFDGGWYSVDHLINCCVTELSFTDQVVKFENIGSDAARQGLEFNLKSHRHYFQWLKYFTQDEGATLKKEWPSRQGVDLFLPRLKVQLSAFEARIATLERLLKGEVTPTLAQPKATPESRPPIEPASLPSPAPARPTPAPTQLAQEPDALLVVGMLNDGKRINRALMQGSTAQLASDMRKWIGEAEIAIRAYNEFTQTNKTPALLRQRPVFSDLRQRIISFKLRLNIDSATPEVNIFITVAPDFTLTRPRRGR